MAKPKWMAGLDQAQIDFYLSLSGPVTVCRGKRRHKFPGLPASADEPVSGLIDITRSSGVYQVTEHCERDCGRTITYDTDRRGVPDYSTARYGGWTSGRQLATGLGLTAHDDQLFMAEQQAASVAAAYQLRQRERDPERQRTAAKIRELREAGQVLTVRTGARS